RISFARRSGIRSSASTMSSQGVSIWSIAQFFCAADPKYSRCTTRTRGTARAISTVRSVENESIRRISSANATLSRHLRMFASSLNVVMMAVSAGRMGVAMALVHPHLHALDLPGPAGRLVHVEDDAGEADVLLRRLEGARRLGEELLDDPVLREADDP